MPAFLESEKRSNPRNGRCSHLLAFLPQALCDGEWINLVLLPPQSLIAGCVVLLMVNGTERYREFVADLEPKALGLGEADVMGVAWRSARK